MKIKVLIVEDEVLVAEEIAAHLKDYGFMITEIAISSDECFASLKNNPPHVILMDIKIKGNLDGIETAKRINEMHNIPIVYLTASSEASTIKRVLESTPSAFISKPYNISEIIIALELAFTKHNDRIIHGNHMNNDHSFFVKSGEQYVRIRFEDINYFEADGSYCIIHTSKKKYIIAYNLTQFTRKIQKSNFIRIHRSYIINLKKVEAFNSAGVSIAGKSLPISKSYQKNTLALFKKL